MPSMKNSQNSLSEGLQIPGLVQNQKPVEQLSFSDEPVTPSPEDGTFRPGPQSSPGLIGPGTTRRPVSQSGIVNPTTPSPVSQSGVINPTTPSPNSTRALLLESQPAVTQALAEALSTSNTHSLRPPVVIQGSGKRSGSVRPPQGRRHVISIAGLVLLFLITGGTLLAVSPLGQSGKLNLNPLSWGNGNLFNNGGSTNLNLMAQQATATAVIHQRNDGFDPTSPGGPVVTGSPHPWPLGVCTYWANLRYHQLTGNWVTWTGNAYQWTTGARLAGWNVSSQPHVPSIIVLMPGVQGSSPYGHVAVVESASGNAAHTSNMNWYNNGGGWDRVSYYDFTIGSGVYFIWK